MAGMDDKDPGMADMAAYTGDKDPGTAGSNSAESVRKRGLSGSTNKGRCNCNSSK